MIILMDRKKNYDYIYIDIYKDNEVNLGFYTLFPLIEDAMRQLENGTMAMFDYLNS